jgi:predicted S18 family serine protease
MKNTDVDKIYKAREDYFEGITEIYVALAAKALSNLNLSRRTESLAASSSVDYAKKVVDYLTSADSKLRMNEFTWLVSPPFPPFPLL